MCAGRGFGGGRCVESSGANASSSPPLMHGRGVLWEQWGCSGPLQLPSEAVESSAGLGWVGSTTASSTGCRSQSPSPAAAAPADGCAAGRRLGAPLLPLTSLLVQVLTLIPQPRLGGIGFVPICSAASRLDSHCCCGASLNSEAGKKNNNNNLKRKQTNNQIPSLSEQ